MSSRRRTILMLATAVAAAVPYVAEQRARAEVRTGFGGDLDDVALDLDGLTFIGVRRQLAGRSWQARRVVVAPNWSGVDVDIYGLRHEALPSRPSSPGEATRKPLPPAAQEQPVNEPLRVPNRGIPVTVVIHDPLTMSARGVEASMDQIRIDIDEAGSVRAQAVVEASAAGHRVRSPQPVLARPLTRSPLALEFNGQFALDDSTKPVPARGIVTESGARVVAGWSDATAELSVDVDPNSRPPRLRRVEASAKDFPISPGWSLLAAHAPVERLGLSPELRVDGEVELVLDDDARLHLSGVELTGLSVNHRKLARSRMRFDTIAVDGDAWFRDAGSFDAQMLVAHRGLTAQVAGSRRGDAIEASIEVAPLSCQELLDSAPEALSEVVHGTRAEGTFEARLALSVSLSELDRIRRLDEDDIDPLHPPRPGSLEVNLPFLEQCTVTDDAPGVDLAALQGAYRHRFVDGRGRSRERAMAAGAPGYVELRNARRIADAFIVLEDTRFYDHDGFDREQMRNAWWHNLVVGRISRGASTISQQTARNLFLGVDRSLGRKLQEAFFTARLESHLPKTRILELYINVIELAPGVHGVEDAAQFYFGKSASQLTALQSIHLASLAPAPHTYAKRFASGEVDEAWMQNLRDQARRMYWHHRLSKAELIRAQTGHLNLVDRTRG